MTDDQFNQLMTQLQSMSNQQQSILDQMNSDYVLGVWLLSGIFLLAGMVVIIAFFVGKGD